MNKELPYIVLKTYIPKENNCSLIGKELTRITKEMGFIPFNNKDIKRNRNATWSSYDLHAEVRKSFIEGSEATEWHQDGDTSTDNMNCAIISWTNKQPTEFKVGDDIFQPSPYQLVISRNLGSYHRRPNRIDGNRYFFRQRVEIPKNLDLL